MFLEELNAYYNTNNGHKMMRYYAIKQFGKKLKIAEIFIENRGKVEK